MTSVTGKAMVATGPGVPWEMREYPIPDPEPDAIVTKITMSSICGSDVHIYKGDFGPDALGSKEKPKILGHEMMGRVFKLGSNVKTDFSGQPLKEGDRVVWCYFVRCGRCPACVKGIVPCPNRINHTRISCEVYPHFRGAFAEYYYVRPGQWLFKIPDEVSDESALYVNCAASTVTYGLHKAEFPIGARVIIQGAGGLGLSTAAIAKDMGASQVIVIDKLPHRLELAKSFGADNTININEDFAPEARINKVKELTGGEGADLVVEVASDPDVVTEGVQMLALNGTYLTMGLVTSRLDPRLNMLAFIDKGVRLIGSANYKAWTIPKVLEFMVRNRDKYPFDKMISHKFKLQDIEEAFKQTIAGKVQRAAIVPDWIVE